MAPSTLSQGPPTSATVTDGAGYSGQLTVSNPNGTVSYTETASADSSDVVVRLDRRDPCREHARPGHLHGIRQRLGHGR